MVVTLGSGTAKTGTKCHNRNASASTPDTPFAQLGNAPHTGLASTTATVATSDGCCKAEHTTTFDSALPIIPLIKTGPDFPRATLVEATTTAHQLLDAATAGIPRLALQGLDLLSRQWLVRTDNPALAEIDDIAALLGRPGAYFLSVNYEWGCTTAVQPAPSRRGAQLVRVLDWRTPGLGRHVIAADVAGASGPFITLTWPGYTGVLQALAPRRFAGAINQAPMRFGAGGAYPLDWFANRIRVWRTHADTPAHVLRRAFETAPDYRTARRILTETPLSTPVIFALAGLKTEELCIIERTETDARVHDGAGCAANIWRTTDWSGRPRGTANAERLAEIAQCGAAHGCSPCSWVRAPVLNPTTRLAMLANAHSGHLTAQGFEASAPATAALHLNLPCP